MDILHGMNLDADLALGLKMFRYAISVNQDGKFLTCFVENADYENVKRILIQHYTTTEKVVDLVSQGNISELGKSIELSKFFQRDIGHLRSRFNISSNIATMMKYVEKNNAARYFVFYKTSWFTSVIADMDKNYKGFQPLL
jgi:hypothetical protein